MTPAPPQPEPGEQPTLRLRTRRRYLQAILDGERDAVTGGQPGTRHSTLLGAACTLGRLVAGGELDAHDARSVLLDAAARHVGVDGMTHREIAATINDGIQYGAQRPRRLAD
jgi:hypothetical protein